MAHTGRYNSLCPDCGEATLDFTCGNRVKDGKFIAYCTLICQTCGWRDGADIPVTLPPGTTISFSPEPNGERTEFIQP
jgi:hypothetical protein